MPCSNCGGRLRGGAYQVSHDVPDGPVTHAGQRTARETLKLCESCYQARKTNEYALFWGFLGVFAALLLLGLIIQTFRLFS